MSRLRIKDTYEERNYIYPSGIFVFSKAGRKITKVSKNMDTLIGLLGGD